jgi:fructokinase
MSASAQRRLYGGIEAGGTKFLCTVSHGHDHGFLARARFDTGSNPAALLQQVVDWFLDAQNQFGPLEAIGVASFGPVEPDPRSPRFGFITTTPKAGWQQTDLLSPLRHAFPGIRLGFDTDVNGAALGEARWGAGQGLEDFVYITVGTGIGGGGFSGGRLLHGLMHPEMGHLSIPRLPGDDFAGVCPFHGHCWEGLCSGPAIAARTGLPVEHIPADHAAWEHVIHAMAHALVNITCILSPRRIILGGSVRRAGMLGEDAFFEKLHAAVQKQLNGYLAPATFSDSGIRDYIVPPKLGDDAGLWGSLALAEQA